ncbi:Transcription initiation factor TFIID subunit 5 like protein, partial [Aduncisulcus paluster]
TYQSAASTTVSHTTALSAGPDTRLGQQAFSEQEFTPTHAENQLKHAQADVKRSMEDPSQPMHQVKHPTRGRSRVNPEEIMSMHGCIGVYNGHGFSKDGDKKYGVCGCPYDGELSAIEKGRTSGRKKQEFQPFKKMKDVGSPEILQQYTIFYNQCLAFPLSVKEDRTWGVSQAEVAGEKLWSCKRPAYGFSSLPSAVSLHVRGHDIATAADVSADGSLVACAFDGTGEVFIWQLDEKNEDDTDAEEAGDIGGKRRLIGGAPTAPGSSQSSFHSTPFGSQTEDHLFFGGNVMSMSAQQPSMGMAEKRHAPGAVPSAQASSFSFFSSSSAPLRSSAAPKRPFTIAPPIVLPCHSSAGILSLKVSHDGKHVLTGGVDGTVRISDAEMGVQTSYKYVDGSTAYSLVRSVDWCPGDHAFCCGGDNMCVKLFYTHTHQPLRIFVGHKSPVTVNRFHASGSLVMSGCMDGSIRMFDLRTGMCVRHFEGHMAATSALASSRDGRLMVSGDRDGRVCIWDVGMGRILGVNQAHTSAVSSIDFDRDDRIFVTGSRDSCVRLWHSKLLRHVCDIAPSSQCGYKSHDTEQIKAVHSRFIQDYLHGDPDDTESIPYPLDLSTMLPKMGIGRYVMQRSVPLCTKFIRSGSLMCVGNSFSLKEWRHMSDQTGL